VSDNGRTDSSNWTHWFWGIIALYAISTIAVALVNRLYVSLVIIAVTALATQFSTYVADRYLDRIAGNMSGKTDEEKDIAATLEEYHADQKNDNMHAIAVFRVQHVAIWSTLLILLATAVIALSVEVNAGSISIISVIVLLICALAYFYMTASPLASILQYRSYKHMVTPLNWLTSARAVLFVLLTIATMFVEYYSRKM